MAKKNINGTVVLRGLSTTRCQPSLFLITLKIAKTLGGLLSAFGSFNELKKMRGRDIYIHSHSFQISFVKIQRLTVQSRM